MVCDIFVWQFVDGNIDVVCYIVFRIKFYIVLVVCWLLNLFDICWEGIWKIYKVMVGYNVFQWVLILLGVVFNWNFYFMSEVQVNGLICLCQDFVKVLDVGVILFILYFGQYLMVVIGFCIFKGFGGDDYFVFLV